MKIFSLKLVGDLDTDQAKEFRSNAKSIFNLKFKDASKRIGYECELDSLKVIGRGAYFLVEKLGKEFLNELLAGEVTSAYLKDMYGNTVQDVFDGIPCFSKLVVEGEFEGYGEIGKFKIGFLKVAEETKQLGEAVVSLMDYIERYTFM